MSVVTLQLGQCGNQVGGQFFKTVIDDINNKPKKYSDHHYEHYCDTSVDRFFAKKDAEAGFLEARSVMVDMEPKVIAQTISDAKKSGKWCYPAKQQFCQKRGSGNNWAHGYCTHGSENKDEVLNMVRREVEKCDHFGGFLMFMSLAGGTGSGVGTYLTECLRDAYPHSFILNQVVSPYKSGEVVVQNYNAILTLSHLYQCADAVLLMENDDLQNICTRLLNMKNITFEAINKLIAHKLATVLQPCFNGKDEATRNHLIHSHTGALLEHLVPHPQYKLLTLRNIPLIADSSREYSTFQWHGLLKHLRQMLVANSAMEEGINWQTSHNRTMSSLLILRGEELSQADDLQFKDKALYSRWAPPSCSYKVWSHSKPFNLYDKSAALLSNCQSPIRSLDYIVGNAWEMFASRAYIHHYLKHGLTEENFVDSIATLEQVICDYKQI